MTTWTGPCPRWPVYWTFTAISRRTRRPATVEEPELPQRRSTLMDPPVEDLLDKVDSKFTLVALSAKRARQINSYYNQLGEGLGFVVPPQVTSVSGKPLTIAFEEIAAGKATYHRLDPGRGGRGGRRGSPTTGGHGRCAAWRPSSPRSPASSSAEVGGRGRRRGLIEVAGPAGGRRVAGGNARPRPAPGARTMTRGPAAGKTVVLGVTGGIAAYKAVEVCRRLVDAGAHVVPVLTEDATRFVGEVTFSALASEPVQKTSVVRGRPHSPHPSRPARRSGARRPGHGPLSRLLRRRASPTGCSPPRSSPPGPR